MINNIHIVPNYFTFDSRVLKETETLLNHSLVNKIFIISLHADGLEQIKRIGRNRILIRLKLKTKKLPNNLIFQIIKYIEFCFICIKISFRKKISITNVHHYGLLPLGFLISKLVNTKLIYDTHELETEVYDLKGLRKVLSKFLEFIFIKSSNLTILVSDSIKNWYSSKYNIDNLVTVLNCPKHYSPKRNKVFHEEHNLDLFQKIILYQGGLQIGRGIEKLLSVFSKFKDEKYILIFMGSGPLSGLVNEYSKEFSNIILHTSVSPDVVLDYTSSADIGIAYIDNDSLNDKYCLPNKFFEYIMAGLPVISNNVPEMRKIVHDHNIGFVATELTVDSLKNAINFIESFDTEDFKTRINNARQLYCWESQEAKLIQSYRDFKII